MSSPVAFLRPILPKYREILASSTGLNVNSDSVDKLFARIAWILGRSSGERQLPLSPISLYVIQTWGTCQGTRSKSCRNTSLSSLESFYIGIENYLRAKRIPLRQWRSYYASHPVRYRSHCPVFINFWVLFVSITSTEDGWLSFTKHVGSFTKWVSQKGRYGRVILAHFRRGKLAHPISNRTKKRIRASLTTFPANETGICR